MYKKFISALTWNSINLFVYKIILLVHQIVLFYVIPHDLYGVSGTLFAALYLLIGCTNFGFEYSLFTCFKQYSKDKEGFKQLVLQCLLKIVCTILVACIISQILHTTPSAQTVSLFWYQIPKQIISYLLIIFVAESIRKYVETIAQLAFLNKQITIIQVTMIICYVTLVWSSYFIHGMITLGSIFIPMIITSCTETLWILTILYQWHKTLPTTMQDHQKPLCIKNRAKEQLFNYINQLSKNLFSPNFLMVLIASQVGMPKTANIRLYTNIITLLYMFFNRSVAIPSGALFSSITQQSFDKTKKLFLTITNSYIQLLYFLAIIIAATTVPQILKHQPESQTISIVLLFILAGFIEYITITYEKLYIVHHKTHQLALINVCSAIAFISAIFKLPLSSSLFLLPMCCIRILTAYLIGLYAYRKWDILPTLMISYKTIATSTAAVCIINLMIFMKNYYITTAAY